MSKEHSKKEFHQRCNACDFQKLKQLENNPAVRKLRDQIEQLTFRLTECKNENQMLKRNLQLAKKMVYQEVGGRDVDFQCLMKHGTESGSKGRQEDVLLLKTKVQELKDYLRELEGEPPKETPSEEFVKNQMPKDAKKLWRMELERRLARETTHKSIQEAIDAEKRIVQQNQDRYREDLRMLQEQHGEDILILDHLQCIVGERNDLVGDLRAQIQAGHEEKETRKKSANVGSLSAKESKMTQPSASKSKTTQPAVSKLNEVAVQVVEAGRLIMLKNEAKKELMEKVSKLQRSVSAAARRKKGHHAVVQPRSRLEELRIKADAQREENNFLRHFLRSAVCNKAKDLQTLKHFIEDTKRFLEASRNEIKKSLQAGSKIDEEVADQNEVIA